MSTSGISSASPAIQAANQPTGFQQNVQTLFQAIQSGNLSAAQQAYATLGQAGSVPGGQTNPFQQALAGIGNYLQSGDISGAQTALQGMQQNMKSHHHHHRADSQDQDANSSAPSQATASVPTPPATASSGVNITV